MTPQPRFARHLRDGDDEPKPVLRRVAIELPRARYATGDVIAGRIEGGGAHEVELVRRERRSGAQRALVVARALAADADGRFEVGIPPSAPPTASGSRCSISYVLRASDAGGAAEAHIELSGTAPVRLDARRGPPDRLLCNWDARQFHIELSDGEPRGGARLAGRVHRHRRWPSRPITVEARCEEWWRTQFAFHGLPDWERATLWRSRCELGTDPDATWAAFAFALPEWLPPAVEGRTVAWRYELWAVTARRGLREAAVVTPLLFEDAPWVEMPLSS